MKNRQLSIGSERHSTKSDTRNHTQVLNLTSLNFFLLFQLFALAAQAQEITKKDKCILELFTNGSATMTIGEARIQCGFSNLGIANPPEKIARDDTGLVKERLESDEKNLLKPFSLMAHESNYLLVGAYNFQGWSTNVYEEASSKDISFDNTEIQFQLSIKTPLAIDLFE